MPIPPPNTINTPPGEIVGGGGGSEFESSFESS